MARDYVPAPKKTFTEVAIENALAEKDQLGTPTTALADKHNVPCSTLQRRIENGPPKKVGRKTVFTPNQVYKFHKSRYFYSNQTA